MNFLQDKIKSIAIQYAEDEWNSQNYAGVASVLDTASVRVDLPRGITLTMIGGKVGFIGQAIVSDTLLQIEEKSIVLPEGQELYRAVIIDARTRLCQDTGLSIHTDDRQALIDLVSALGQWEQKMPGLTAIIKSMGTYLEKPWKFHGLTSAPTASDIELTYQADLLDKDWNGKQALIDAAIPNGRQAVIDTLRNISNDLEGI